MIRTLKIRSDEVDKEREKKRRKYAALRDARAQIAPIGAAEQTLPPELDAIAGLFELHAHFRVNNQDNKQYVNDHRNVLERQNEHFKALIKCCMQEIRDMKTENDSLNLADSNVNRSRSSNRIKGKFSRQINRKKSKVHKRVPCVTSTPLTIKHGQNVTIHYHQGTQTEAIFLQPNVEALENSMKILYKQYLNLLSKLNLDCNALENGIDESSDETSRDLNHYEKDVLTEHNADSNVNHSRSSNRIKGMFSRQKNRKESKVHKCVPRVTSTRLTIKHGQNVTIHYHQGTQTEAVFLHPKVEALENSIKMLYKQILNLLSKLNLDWKALENGIDESSDETSTDFNNYENDVLTEHNVGVTSSERISPEYEREVRPVVNVETEAVNDVTGSDEPLNAIKTSATDAPSCSRSNVSNTHAPKVRKISRQSSNSTNRSSVKMSHDKDLAPIGNGYAKVPLRLLNGIDWTSHTTATRHLLQAVFPRSVLATHCLTGKTSPAFMNRPPKKILDPKLVEDIVKVVSTRCNVPKNLVRHTITIKCTDESKLYRKRQQCKLQRRANQNEENTPPVAPSADDVEMNEN